jgi:hypothetical protein
MLHHPPHEKKALVFRAFFVSTRWIPSPAQSIYPKGENEMDASGRKTTDYTDFA